MRVRTLTSIIAVSGGEYTEGTTLFGISILRILDGRPEPDHKGLIRASSGVHVALRSTMHMLKHAPADVEHIVVSREKLIEDTLNPDSPLYGWHPDGTPKRADVAGLLPDEETEYKILKTLSDEGRFKFTFLPDRMTTHRRRFGVARGFAKHTRLRAEYLGLTLEAGQELWDSELDRAEGKQ